MNNSLPFSQKCDMIKVNELDVGNIDLELQAKIDDKCLCIILLLNGKESFISLQPDAVHVTHFL